MPFGLRYESIGIAKGSTNDPDRNRPSASGGLAALHARQVSAVHLQLRGKRFLGQAPLGASPGECTPQLGSVLRYPKLRQRHAHIHAVRD